LKLSDERPKAVHDYLEKNFSQINPDNLVSKGYGESQPVASNDTDEGRTKNRRVEFKILKWEVALRSSVRGGAGCYSSPPSIFRTW
jgi:flagellar motor protein MotB